MKLLLLVICTAAAALAQDSSIGDLDLSEVLGNDRLVLAYSKCLLNQGPCTPEVKKLKDKIPNILETQCGKCSDKQKHVGKELVTEIRSKHPEVWAELAKFYDPQGRHKQALEDFLKS